MKGVKVLSILGIVLLIVGVTGVLLTYSSEKETVTEERDIEDTDFNKIDVTTDNALVDIVATTDTTPKVVLTGKRSKSSESDLAVDVVDHKLSIQLKEGQKKLYNLDLFSAALNLKVYVPEDQYQTLSISSDNGKMNLSHLNAAEIDASSSNGRLEMNDITGTTLKAMVDNGLIHAENLQVEDVNLALNNGRIDLQKVEASRVKAETDNGKIVLDDVVGEIIGKTNNGRISLVTNDLDHPIDLHSDNGSIKILTQTRPENVRFDVQVDNGKVNILDEFDGSTVIGDGDNLIKLTTNNGKITVSQ